MGRDGQTVVEEAFFDHLGVLLELDDRLTELLVVQRDLVSFNEVVVKVDRKNLSILNPFLMIFG